MVIFLPVILDGGGYEDLVKISKGNQNQDAAIVFEQEFPAASKKRSVTTTYGIPTEKAQPPQTKRVDPYPAKRGRLFLDDPNDSNKGRADGKADTQANTNDANTQQQTQQDAQQDTQQWFVRSGVFSDRANADKLAAKISKELSQKTIQRVEEKDGKPVHIVLIGPLNEATAKSVKGALSDKLKIKGAITK